MNRDSHCPWPGPLVDEQFLIGAFLPVDKQFVEGGVGVGGNLSLGKPKYARPERARGLRSALGAIGLLAAGDRWEQRDGCGAQGAAHVFLVAFSPQRWVRAVGVYLWPDLLIAREGRRNTVVVEVDGAASRG